MESSARRVQLYSPDERRVIEDAVNTAIRALLDAIHGVNSDKIVKYQSVVEERDKEIGRLEHRLRQNELEQRVLRGQRDGYRRMVLELQGPGDADHGGEEDRYEVPAGYEGTAGYDVPAGEEAITNGLDFPNGPAERPPSLCGEDPDRTGPYSLPPRHPPPGAPSSSCSPWGPPDAGLRSPGRRYSPRPAGPRVKEEEEEEEEEEEQEEQEEEPSSCEAFFIKLEMSEQSCGSGAPDDRGPPDRPRRSPAHSRRLTDAERNKRYRQRCRSTPEGLQACREKERIRYLKRRVLVAEMSEEARRRKREMWRAAARRHRDRKTGGLPPHCPPAGGDNDDLFADWPALGDARSPTQEELDHFARTRDHRQHHSDPDV